MIATEEFKKNESISYFIEEVLISNQDNVNKRNVKALQ